MASNRYSYQVWITNPDRHRGILPLPDRMQCPADDVTDRQRADRVCELMNTMTGFTCEVRKCSRIGKCREVRKPVVSAAMRKAAAEAWQGKTRGS